MGAFKDWFFGVEDTRVPENRSDNASTTSSVANAIPSRERVTGVTDREALSLGAVYRAVEIRVTAIKQLSLDVERAGAIIDTPSILRRPDLDSTLGTFIERTVVSLNITGNAYWRVRKDSAGVVNSLEVLNPHDVTIQTSESGRVTGYVHRGHDLRADEVQHLAKMRIPGTPYGLGPIAASAAAIRGFIDLRDYSANWLVSGDVPSGIVSLTATIDNATADAIRDRWALTRGGKRGVAVLGGGASYTPVYLSPADAQFLESQQFSVTEIARLFGVPASLMLATVEGSSLTYANVSQEWLGFVRFGLAGDLREIEDAFTAVLPRGQRARFNVEALLRMDTATRYAAHASGIAAGWLLPSEVRAIENLPPVAGIDDRAPKTIPTKDAA